MKIIRLIRLTKVVNARLSEEETFNLIPKR